MKKLLAPLALLALVLTGCGAEGSAPGPTGPPSVDSRWGLTDKLYSETITLPDGRIVTCVVLENSSENYSYGGVSCDWDSANGLIVEESR